MNLDLNHLQEFAERALPRGLSQEMATRRGTWDFTGGFRLLPNPDPVLSKLADQGEEVLVQLTADPHVTSVMQTRKLGTLRREFRFASGEANGNSMRHSSEALLSRFQEDLEAQDLHALIAQLLDAPFFGMTPVELIWKQEAGHLRLQKIRPVPASWFRFDQDNNPLLLRQDHPQGVELPWGKFLLVRHFPSYRNPYGLRLLSRCFWPVSFKKGGIKFWVMLAEKYGLPLLVGKYPAGTPAEGQEDLLNSLAAAVRDAVLVLPEGNQVEIQQGAQGGEQIHQELVELMNREISKVILGQNLTTETQGGSFAAAKTHYDVLGSYLEADQKMVKHFFNQLGQVYQRLNDPQAMAPRFNWFEEEDPKAELAERDLKLKGLGLEFSAEYLCRQYGLKPEDFRLKKEANGNPSL